MIKLKRVVSCIVALVCISSTMLYVRAENVQNESEANTILKEIIIEYSEENDEFTAALDLNGFDVGEKITLYDTEECTVSLEYINFIPASTKGRAANSYDSGWSSGYMPSGTSTYEVSMTTNDIYVHFYTDVTCYPVSLTAPYRYSINVPVLQEITYFMPASTRLEANNSNPAVAKVIFAAETAYGNTIDNGSLSFEVDYLGRCRTRWSYNYI